MWYSIERTLIVPLLFVLSSLCTQEDDDSSGLGGSERDSMPNEEDVQEMARKNNISLLDQHTQLKKIAEGL